mmetsp:Transcript_3089/g.7162  ORF Transcript_3089/g.7162 Transcript_3089/m.7162 type:complete len:295 (+) Transcript_3089:570-1454(+)
MRFPGRPSPAAHLPVRRPVPLASSPCLPSGFSPRTVPPQPNPCCRAPRRETFPRRTTGSHTPLSQPTRPPAAWKVSPCPPKPSPTAASFPPPASTQTASPAQIAPSPAAWSVARAPSRAFAACPPAVFPPAPLPSPQRLRRSASRCPRFLPASALGAPARPFRFSRRAPPSPASIPLPFVPAPRAASRALLAAARQTGAASPARGGRKRPVPSGSPPRSPPSRPPVCAPASLAASRSPRATAHVPSPSRGPARAVRPRAPPPAAARASVPDRSAALAFRLRIGPPSAFSRCGAR